MTALRDRWFAPWRLAATALSPFALGRDDVILASFPRSGSTWLRFFLAHLYAQETGADLPIDFRTIDALMPEIGRRGLFRRHWAPGLPRVVKTHYRSNPLLRGTRSVLLVRDPLMTLHSYFRFRRRLRVQRFSGTWREFLEHPRFGFPAWLSHYQSWMPVADLVVRYEDLSRGPATAMNGLIHALGIAAGEERIARALQRSSPPEMRRIEQQFGHARQDSFVAGRAFMESASADQPLDPALRTESLEYLRDHCGQRLPAESLAHFPYRETCLMADPQP